MSVYIGKEFDTATNKEYKKQDDTVVFDTGNANPLTIEIYNLENPVARQVQVSYWEAGEYFILDTHRLMCAGN